MANSLLIGILLGVAITLLICLAIKDALISYFLKHAIFQRKGQFSEAELSKIKNIQLIGKYLDVLTKTRNNLAYMLNFNKDLTDEQKKDLWDNINETDNLIREVNDDLFDSQEEENEEG